MRAMQRLFIVFTALLSLGATPVWAQAWSATWGAAPAGPPPAARLLTLSDQTLRLVVHTSIGGNRVRIRLSNEMGSTPLRIGAAHIGLRATGGVVAAGTDRTLTFNGARTVAIPAGARLVSDAVSLSAPALADLAVSLFLPGASAATTLHPNAFQTSYVSLPGDFTGSPSMPVKGTIGAWPFLAGVDVDVAAPVVVAFGDSITDGLKSTANTNRRWPDYLARRLQALGQAGRAGVVNRGISANQLLRTEPNALLAGRSGLERFDRDVLSTPGVRAVVVLIGINDISYYSASQASLASAYRALVARGRARGIRVYGATLLPFEGSPYYTPTREAIRQSVNRWLRTGGAFDGIVDFDAAMRDPARPTRLLPAVDSGDHLHPNDQGYQRMANAVPLGWITAALDAPPSVMLAEPSVPWEGHQAALAADTP